MYKDFFCLCFSSLVYVLYTPIIFFVPHRLLFIAHSLLGRNSRKVWWTSMQAQLSKLSQQLLKFRDNITTILSSTLLWSCWDKICCTFKIICRDNLEFFATKSSMPLSLEFSSGCHNNFFLSCYFFLQTDCRDNF